MKMSHSWTLALKALTKNKLQTALTMIGMTIGVATVLTMIALGSGAQAAIQDQVRSAGMNLIVVTAGNYNVKLELGTADGVEGPAASSYMPDAIPRPAVTQTATWNPRSRPRFLLAQGEGITSDPSVAPSEKRDGPIRLLPRQGDIAAGMGAATTLTVEDAAAIRKIKGVQFTSGGVRENVHVLHDATTRFTALHGDDVNLPLIRRAWTFPFGRFFSGSEERKAENVAVLGQIVSEQLFGQTNPVGQTIRLGQQTFKVVGVIGSGSWMVRPEANDDQFDAVYIPLSTMQKIYSHSYLGAIAVTTESTGDVTRVSKLITGLLRQRHHIGSAAPDDFSVTSEARKVLAKGGMKPEVAHAVVGNVAGFEKVTLDQLGKSLDRASATMTALLTSIAGVSLLVGGIGIMNIMLLSVSLRTREIGIRRAVGAKARDVLAQFLLEAVTLSLVGGVAGIAIGSIASRALSQLVQWSTQMSLPAILVSFCVSAAIGIFFGYYPARQASQVLPIESLRYE
jgi:putative ABC transport system permease protein